MTDSIPRPLIPSLPLALRLLACCGIMVLSLTLSAVAHEPVYPGKDWVERTPAEVGLDAVSLKAFSDYVGGRGCVVRHGYLVHRWGDGAKRADVASACKPWFTHFLLAAVEAGTIKSLDEKVVRFEPRLAELNKDLGQKDRDITWRHLANQCSCYGVEEAPGRAYDYNDHQIAMFADALFAEVYRTTWDKIDREVLGPLLTDVLQCQDQPTFLAFGPRDRPGRLGISVRDFARFGLLYLRQGKWRDRQVISQKHVKLATTSPLSVALPRTRGRPAEMIASQRTLGGGANQTDHFGSSSWLWWTNGVDRNGVRMWADAPPDTYGAFGHGGLRALWVIPSLDLVVSYNDVRLDGWTNGAKSPTNQAMKRLVQAVVQPSEGNAPAGKNDRGDKHAPRKRARHTEVSIRGEQFFINGKPTYEGRTWRGHKIEGLLFNSRMVQGTFDDLNTATRGTWAYPDTGRWDAERNTREFLAAMPQWRKHGLLASTLNLQGGSPQGYSKDQPWHNSALTADGGLRADYMARLERILDRADELGMVVNPGPVLLWSGRAAQGRAGRQTGRRQHGGLAAPARLPARPPRGQQRVQRAVRPRHSAAGARPRADRAGEGSGAPRSPPAGWHKLRRRHHSGREGGPGFGLLAAARQRRGRPAANCRNGAPHATGAGFRAMPILLNEDDHYDFDKPDNNLTAAVSQYASWGFFDFRRASEAFEKATRASQ